MAPTISSITPRTITRGEQREFTVAGTGFVSGFSADVALGIIAASGLSVVSTAFDSSEQVRVTLEAEADGDEGFWDLSITNPDLSEDTLEAAVTLTQALGSAPAKRHITLYYARHYAGNDPATNRGFGAALLAGGWAQAMSDNGDAGGSYLDFKAEAAAFGVTLGFMPQNPFGRGSASATIPVSGNSTTQRLDQKRQLWLDGYTSGNASYEDFLANTTPEETIVYVGSCSLSTAPGDVAGEGYHELLNLGYGLVADALTQHEGSTPLFDEFEALHQAGFDVLTEANGTAPEGSYGLPALAFAGLWANGSRMQPGAAPPMSGHWWRTEANDGAWSLSTNRGFVLSGARRRLFIRLDQLGQSDRFALYAAVAAFERNTHVSRSRRIGRALRASR